VADNDLAVGRAVEAHATGPTGKTPHLFILEDDARKTEGGPRTDAHRSVGPGSGASTPARAAQAER